MPTAGVGGAGRQGCGGDGAGGMGGKRMMQVQSLVGSWDPICLVAKKEHKQQKPMCRKLMKT